MNIQEKLTKENFWNDMMEKYPKAMKEFCEWIDEYKYAIGWDSIFSHELKYHDLPYAMQQGIWMEFAHEKLEHNFEQPEYIYHGDLAEDVDIVLKELEEVLNYES